jgi:hypothetical protein
MRQNPITHVEGWKMWYEAISNLYHIEENKRQYEDIMVQAQNKDVSEIMQNYVNLNGNIYSQPRTIVTNDLAIRLSRVTHEYSMNDIKRVINEALTQDLFSERASNEFSLDIPFTLPKNVQQDFIHE